METDMRTLPESESRPCWLLLQPLLPYRYIVQPNHSQFPTSSIPPYEGVWQTTPSFSSVTLGFNVAFLDENGIKTTTFRTATTFARYYSTSATTTSISSTSTSISSTATSTSTSDHQYLARSHYIYLVASSKPVVIGLCGGFVPRDEDRRGTIGGQ
jgi:hypothetical protein